MKAREVIYCFALFPAINGMLHLYIGETTNAILAYCLTVMLFIYAEVYGIRKSEKKRGDK